MPACRYEFYLPGSTRHLTRLLHSLMRYRVEHSRYRVEHSKIKFISMRGHVISSVSHIFCFVFCQQLTFIFSWFYIRFYQDHAQSEVSSTLTGILALAITLLTTALVPVDIFLVSYMKNADGTWKVCYLHQPTFTD